MHEEGYDHRLDGEVESACALAAPFPSQLMKVGEGCCTSTMRQPQSLPTDFAALISRPVSSASMVIARARGSREKRLRTVAAMHHPEG